MEGGAMPVPPPPSPPSTSVHFHHRRVQSDIPFGFHRDLDFLLDIDQEDAPVITMDDDHDLLASYMDMEKNNIDGMNDIYYFNNDDHDKNNNNVFKIHHSYSMDSFCGTFNCYGSNNENGKSNYQNREAGPFIKKAMSPDKLAELWTVDPKRAKRILANRQSAARSKERKARYMVELEKRLHSLQTEATTLSAQLLLFERDTNHLFSENTELRRQLESMEQQAQLRDALNDALKAEVDRLKAATGESTSSTDHALIVPIQNAPSPHQPPHNMPNQLPSYPYKSNILNLHNLEINTSEASHPQPSEVLNMSHLSLLDSELSHPDHQTLEPNMSNLAQPVMAEPLQYPPISSPKTRMTQFLHVNNSTAGQVGQYFFESNMLSPQQQVYVTSQSHMIPDTRHVYLS